MPRTLSGFALVWVALLGAALGLLVASPLHAQEPVRRSRLVVDAATAKVLINEGENLKRRSPCSTFKIPLALIGYDTGILKNAHEPRWDYPREYRSTRVEEREATDPTRWEQVSVVWYSQEITKRLGAEAFQRYIDGFGYGNKDLSGTPGKANGLTHSWLSSSLQISPIEQAAFLHGLLAGRLKASPYAHEMTRAIIPRFETADGWRVHGKTGSGFQRGKGAKANERFHYGWFVGWAEKGERRVIFVETLEDLAPSNEYAGPRCRETFLKALPELLK